MQKIRSEFPEIEDIKHDLDSLKTNVVELTKHIKSEGRVEAGKLGELARARFEELRDAAGREYHKAEKHVKSKPGQSIAIAFAAGIAASWLLGRR